MNSLQEFSRRLKNLRGVMPIKDLAARAGVSVTALYKAEGGSELVAWKTVEAAYGDLCGSDASYAELLTAWAVTQSQRRVHAGLARKTMSKVMEESAREVSREMRVVQEEMERMDLPEQRDFAQFSRHFRQSKYTREMAKVWMDSSEAMIRQMGGGKYPPGK